MIRIDVEKCLGCFSCSNICPNKNIICEENGALRTISFKKCGEECDLCVEFCPAKALALVPESDEISMTFELMACKICGSYYTTEPMLKRIETSLPLNLQKDSTDLAWIWICPACRRKTEAERATEQIVLGRLKKDH
jgi:Pyruvate/2-oxoacid:ferredoxin oxidoreductase delta subunit